MGKFVFQEIGGRNGKFLSETARFMINQTETKENELLFLGMNGLELKMGKQGKQNNESISKFISVAPVNLDCTIWQKKAFVSGEIPRPYALVTHLKKNLRR